MPTYPGGKNGMGVFQTLINLMPPHDVYIEPFLGAGAVMRHKRPARMNIGLDLVLSPGMTLEYSEASTSRKREAVPAERRRRSPKAAMAAASVRNGGNAGTAAAPVSASSAEPVHFPDGPYWRTTVKSSGPGPRFHFYQGDGIKFIEAYPFTGRELIYCDPPYLMETRSGRRLYENEMDTLEHRRLLRILLEVNAMVMISGYSSALYAKELKSWNATAYQTTTRGGRAVAEWVWFNFPRPVELHDYRYLGSNFREREKIRRQQKRWKGKLARMDTLQRQALLCAIAETAGLSDAGSARRI